MTVRVRSKIKTLIEEKFITPEKIRNLSVLTDPEHKKLYFGKAPNGNKVIIINETNDIPVIIEYCKNGSKIYHIQSDSSKLPAMHKVLANGSEVFYLFDENIQLNKIVQINVNGCKRISNFTNQ